MESEDGNIFEIALTKLTIESIREPHWITLFYNRLQYQPEGRRPEKWFRLRIDLAQVELFSTILSRFFCIWYNKADLIMVMVIAVQVSKVNPGPLLLAFCSPGLRAQANFSGQSLVPVIGLFGVHIFLSSQQPPN